MNRKGEMSAPSIPNLLSLRGRGSGGVRGGLAGGRGRGGFSAAAGTPGAAAAHDATIQGTDTDAAVSRCSAVDVGYLDDPYAECFVQSVDGPRLRRLPIINRGTYTRTMGLDTLVDAFLSESGSDAQASPRQIVSLGAGTDTRPFRIFSRPSRQNLIYHEIDFEVVSAKKLRTVQNSPLLSGVIRDATKEEEGSSWTGRPVSGGEYYCHGLDLRRFAAETADDPIVLPGLRPDVPTLVLSECCLCYLTGREASKALEYFTSKMANLATIIYEPTKPDDAFGKIMVSNLAARNIKMPTLSVYRSGQDQEQRLSQAGFELVRHVTVERIWNTWVKPEERERVDDLEGLDEVEEWQLLADHYVVVWGSKGEGFGAWDAVDGGQGGD